MNVPSLDDGSLWWWQLWEGFFPETWASGDVVGELTVTLPSGEVYRAFSKTPSPITSTTTAGLRAAIAYIDAAGGVHLPGFRLRRPVIVLPEMSYAINSSVADYNYIPPFDPFPANGSIISVHEGTVMTVCDAVDGDNHNRVCKTGTVAKQ
jgi:hypothetical protein